MTRRQVVIGQKVDEAKVARSKELRREMTAGEKILWHRLRLNRLHGYHFRRQQVIDGFIVDFYCHSAGVVVEVDGAGHQGEQEQEYDAERDRILSASGLRVLRFSNAEVTQDLNSVLVQIATACGQPG